MISQPYVYRRHELAEPDWRRFPGWPGLSALAGDHLEGFVHDLAAIRIQATRAGRTRLAPVPWLGRGVRRRLGIRPVAARSLRQEHAPAPPGHRAGTG